MTQSTRRPIRPGPGRHPRASARRLRSLLTALLLWGARWLPERAWAALPARTLAWLGAASEAAARDAGAPLADAALPARASTARLAPAPDRFTAGVMARIAAHTGAAARPVPVVMSILPARQRAVVAWPAGIVCGVLGAWAGAALCVSYLVALAHPGLAASAIGTVLSAVASALVSAPTLPAGGMGAVLAVAVSFALFAALLTGWVRLLRYFAVAAQDA